MRSMTTRPLLQARRARRVLPAALDRGGAGPAIRFVLRVRRQPRGQRQHPHSNQSDENEPARTAVGDSASDVFRWEVLEWLHRVRISVGSSVRASAGIVPRLETISRGALTQKRARPTSHSVEPVRHCWIKRRVDLCAGVEGPNRAFRLALRGKQPSTRSLYVVSTGANDYRDDPFNVPMNPVDVVNNIEQAVVNLSASAPAT